ncbi:hypothetical protein Csa_020141, partial [Cucumis sativus]
ALRHSADASPFRVALNVIDRPNLTSFIAVLPFVLRQSSHNLIHARLQLVPFRSLFSC